MHRELLNDVSSFLLNDTHTQKIDGKQKKAKIGKRKEKGRERERKGERERTHTIYYRRYQVYRRKMELA
jgi:hypothetical protein